MKHSCFCLLLPIILLSANVDAQQKPTNPVSQQITGSETALTDDSADSLSFGVISVSVANMRSSGQYRAEMVSQALLGTPVRILQRNGWLQIQTPDDYTGYVTPGAIQKMNRESFEKWEKTPKIIYTAIYGNIYDAPDKKSLPVSDVVAGCRFEKIGERKGFYEILFPDGRKGFVSKKESSPFDKWYEKCDASPQNIIASAYQLMGIPYLWGGTSVKGMDCSGFIKTIAWMNGRDLPRDASQQAVANPMIAPGNDYENLKPGDLLFFGRPATTDEKARVVHVALYLGEKRFMHAASRIRINSFDPASAQYDDYNTNRFLWATRPFSN